jgi:hypothetical protein
MTLDLVEGWTGPVPVTLEADGAAQNLTGLTVAAQLYDKDGTAVTTTGDVSVTTAASGEVEWTPDAADLDADLSPYELRFKVTDGSGLDVFFPNKIAVAVVVRR